MNLNYRLLAVKEAVEVLEKALEASKKHNDEELMMEIEQSIKELKLFMSSQNKQESSKLLTRAFHLIKILYFMFGE
ncbi:hypothetical protein Q4530_14185 [Colwellia sp. 1_MG-2023]|uniref:hypothetical protein n=1 Tax=unclassified Colwellia TaxID=196834 RepID=UPI001C09541A|nr:MULTISPECIES: hypothetical protein [unclassified Colwellia]MBU2925531.1 hypothetical protein [Colwellia sp. C2M11]MDO6651500.1 hypothetical protein [Colwellia sp. 3_MG-2023]MDO6667075.1 hypothetical protein [Colwellia sp. 2_MG-2023]MDO6690925.1 hypothetical protein [Colwellia sp. 1_MG-2023]